MDKDEDREVVLVRFRTDDVEIQALGNRELEFFMRQRLLNVAVFQLTCFCRLKTTWSISLSALHGMLTWNTYVSCEARVIGRLLTPS